MGGSVFFLQQQGYKVLLNSKEDLQNIAARYSGHFHNATGQLSGGKLGTTPSKEMVLRAHAYEVNFIGSSSNATIVPDKPLNTYNNYYKGSDPSKWASNCKIYQAITYQNIYPGVDVRYYTGSGNLKYDLVIHPGADPNKIILKFTGVDGLSVKN